MKELTDLPDLNLLSKNFHVDARRNESLQCFDFSHRRCSSLPCEIPAVMSHLSAAPSAIVLSKSKCPNDTAAFADGAHKKSSSSTMPPCQELDCTQEQGYELARNVDATSTLGNPSCKRRRFSIEACSCSKSPLLTVLETALAKEMQRRSVWFSPSSVKCN